MKNSILGLPVFASAMFAATFAFSGGAPQQHTTAAQAHDSNKPTEVATSGEFDQDDEIAQNALEAYRTYLIVRECDDKNLALIDMVDLRPTLKEMDEHLIQARYDPDVLWEVATATQDEGSYAYFRVAIELSLAFALGDVNSLSFGDQLELDSHCTKLVGYSNWRTNQPGDPEDRAVYTGPRVHCATGPLCHGSTGPRFHGSMGPLCHGSTG